MSVSEPYYSRQQTPVQQYPVQPVQPMPVQQVQPQQPLIRPVVREEESIERPNEKNVPKFAQMLRNLGRKRNGDN